MKIEEIRPENLIRKQAKILKKDIASLKKHLKGFIRVSCPACAGKSSQKVFSKYGLNFEKCQKCECIFMNPRPTPAILNEYYRTSENYTFWSKYIFPASEKTRAKQIFAPRAKKVAELFKDKTSRSLMDIGAAFGTFCLEVKKLNKFKRIVGVEPTPELARVCRDRKIEVIEAPFEKVKINEKFDAISAFEVIEHIFKPEKFIEKVRTLLKKDGFLILTCPNSKSFEIAYLSERSDSVDNEHLNLFNPESLSRLLRSCGFEVVEVLTPGKLDVELVTSKQKMQGVLKLLTDKPAFQQFLADNLLSSHMWLVAQKKRK